MLARVLICVLLACGTAWPARVNADDSLMLLSISGVVVSKGQFVEGFSLKTRNLRVLAVCHIPAGWSKSVDGPIGPDAAVTGGASGGVAALGSGDLKELRGMFLLQRLNAADTRIEGAMDIEVRGESPAMINKPLRAENFMFEPGDRCPAPR